MAPAQFKTQSAGSEAFSLPADFIHGPLCLYRTTICGGWSSPKGMQQ
jgi:hypothetical protein